MGVNNGSAVLSGIKRLVKNTAKSLDLKALEHPLPDLMKGTLVLNVLR